MQDPGSPRPVRSKFTLNFDPQGPQSPSDPRVLPASMQITLNRQGQNTYIEWNLTEGIGISSTNDCDKERPYIVKTLLSPTDARMIARALLDAAASAEGGSGLEPSLEPPPPPPVRR
jgi:hypothetical protein